MPRQLDTPPYLMELKMLKATIWTAPIAAFGGAVFGYFGHGFILSPPTTSADCGTWAAAISTFCTACAAIWLATREDRRRRAQQRVAAINAAVSIKWSVNVLHHTIKSLSNQLRDFDQRINPADNVFSLIAAEIDEQPIWIFSATDKLVYLEGSLANSLGSATDIIKAQSYMLKHSHTNAPGTTLEEKRERAKKFLPRFERAQGLLEDVMTELKKYSLSTDLEIQPFL